MHLFKREQVQFLASKSGHVRPYFPYNAISPLSFEAGAPISLCGKASARMKSGSGELAYTGNSSFHYDRDRFALDTRGYNRAVDRQDGVADCVGG